MTSGLAANRRSIAANEAPGILELFDRMVLNGVRVGHENPLPRKPRTRTHQIRADGKIGYRGRVRKRNTGAQFEHKAGVAKW